MSRPGMAPWILAAWLFVSGFGWPPSGGSLSDWSEPPGAEARARAVRELSMEARPPRAAVIEALQQGLRDEATDVRREAARALGRLGVQQSLPALAECLRDPAADVRQACARALGELGQSRTAPALARSLADPDPAVRLACLEALGRLGTGASRPEVIAALTDNDARVRAAAARTLARTADATSAGALARRVEDPAPDVRVAALEALSKLTGAGSLHVYLRARDDAAEPVVIAALSAIGASGDGDAGALLAPYVTDPRDRVARAAFAALAIRPDHDSARVALAHAVDPRMRGLAAAVLHRISQTGPALRATVDAGLARGIAFGDPASVSVWLTLAAARGNAAPSPALLSALQTELSRTRLPLQDVLAALHDRSTETCARLFARGPGNDATERRALLRAVTPCVERAGGLWSAPLREWLAQLQRDEVSPALVRLVGATESADMAEALRPLLDSPRWQLRAAALEALAHTGGPADAAAALDAMQHDPVIEVQAAAAGAYGSLAARDALRPLWGLPTNLRRQAPFWVAATGALRADRGARSKRDKRLVTALRQAILDGSDERAASAAMDAIVAWDAPEGWALLREVGARHTSARRMGAARALGHTASPETRAHLETLAGAPDAGVAAAALTALAPHLSADDAPWLLSLARGGTWPVGPTAAFVLARLVDRGALTTHSLPGLCELALSPEPHTSANGIAALAALDQLDCARAMLTAARALDDVRGRSARRALGDPAETPTQSETPTDAPWLALQYADGRVAVVPAEIAAQARAARDLQWVGSAYHAAFLRLPPQDARN